MKVRGAAFPIRDMIITAMFTAILCVVAPFSISIGQIPLTLATLIIYLTAGLFGWKYGVISVGLYVLLGAIGIPVFTNFEGGFHKIAGVTGGYIIGYIPCALVIGRINGASGNKRYNSLTYAFGMVIGTALLYTCGTAWFTFQTGGSVATALALCVVPFLIGDTIKIVLACIIAPKLRSALSRSVRN